MVIIPSWIEEQWAGMDIMRTAADRTAEGIIGITIKQVVILCHRASRSEQTGSMVRDDCILDLDRPSRSTQCIAGRQAWRGNGTEQDIQIACWCQVKIHAGSARGRVTGK